MKWIAIGCVLSLLAACGVDGPPERPEKKTRSGIFLTGKAEVGIVGGTKR